MLGAEQARGVEKNFLLQMIDLQWREHLMHLDHLRNVIGLRGYGQRDPLNEYKVEAFALFQVLQGSLKQNVTKWLMTVEFRYPEAQPEPAPAPRGGLFEVHMDPETGENERGGDIPDPYRRSSARPCPSPPCPPTGPAPAATRPAPAAQARSSNTATARWFRPGARPNLFRSSRRMPGPR